MRDVAYWPKTFLDEIESKTIDKGVQFWALGGPSFVYRTPQTTIWIDPYFYGTPDDAVPDAYRAVAIPINPDEVSIGDIIISTHDHVDHCHEGTIVPILSHTQAFCVGPQSSAKKMREWGIAEDRIREVKPGDTITFRDVTLQVYGSYDPGEPHAVTFVVASGGTTFFISGDTSDCPVLDEVGSAHDLDYALLAFGRTWYMSEAQLISAACKLHPKTLLPFHWEFWRNHTGSIANLFKLYYQEKPNFDIEILLIGDSIRFGQSA
ncbi:MAG: MBL fold metallo-hydrolase [Anaerolineae bacterium]|nr:MBL fold metallo-hydrolase [Anaerolineae bacterium]